MKGIKRRSAGVMFESDVLTFIDQLAIEHRRNRSFIINQIVRQYVRMVQQQKVVAQPKEEPIHAGLEITF